jgi:ATP-dependent Clp protease ATP-binding subunit ClpA
VEKGYDPQYGARPMRRAVERFFEDPLAEEILKGALHEGEPITSHSGQRQAGLQVKNFTNFSCGRGAQLLKQRASILRLVKNF